MTPAESSVPQSTRDADLPYRMTVDAICQALDTDIEQGLSKEEAARRLEEYGPNEVESAEMASWWEILLKQFLDPLIYILFAAAVIALLFGDYIDSSVIMAVLIINGGIGFFQEWRARKAILSLAELTAPQARVVRGGTEGDISSTELVPGDVVLLRSGDQVPADLRLSSARELTADESALTGESVPVSKQTAPLEEEHLVAGDQVNMAFSTTVITRGRGRAVVVRTGSETELGQIASAMRDVVDTRAPIQLKVRTLSHWIGASIAAMAVLVGVVGWLQARALDEVVSMIIAMAVAAIPEALPIVLTVTLAVGVQRMADRNAITRSLPAVETLGSTTVIGSDKTGTLTLNEMTVKSIWAGRRLFDVPGSGYDVQGGIEFDGAPADLQDETALRAVLLAGLLANEAQEIPTADKKEGDPTELALLVSAEKGGLSVDDTRRRYPLLDTIPFESERQFMAALVDNPDDGRVIYLKGSPEAIVDRCQQELTTDGIDTLDSEAALEMARELASRGYRVLAMARGPWESKTLGEEMSPENQDQDFVFLGLQAMEDPLRPETREAVDQARSAGIRVLMLTGDHIETAQAIGEQLGLGSQEQNAVEGRNVHELDEEEFTRVVSEIDIYARVAPEHKLRIVEALKADDQIVAVTGDGVNDAPALRAAHLGIAMGQEGTDVAREASDMILSDDNFASIAAAIEEGRVAFNNIRKVTYFLLSTGVGLVLTILLALFAGWPLPFVAVQVLWINLVTKGLQDVALAFEPGEPGLLDLPPRPVDEGVFHRPVLIRMLGLGVFLALGTITIFWGAMELTGDLVLSQSIAMTQMVVFQFFHVANCRSLHRSILQVPPFSNRALFAAVSAAFLAHIAILYIPALQFLFQTAPLTLEHWGIIFAVGFSVILVAEIDKLFLRRRGFGPGLAKTSTLGHEDRSRRPLEG